jgi:signal transduction histidine kinase
MTPPNPDPVATRTDTEEPILTWLQARGDRYRTRLSVPPPDRKKIDQLRDAAIIRVRSQGQAVDGVTGELEPDQRLELERRRLWTRLATLLIPVPLVYSFGASAGGAAAISVACSLLSYGLVWLLLRYWPQAVRNGQMTLRLLDVCWIFIGLFDIHVVMLRETGSTTDILDSLYVLCVVAAAATNGMRGAVLATVASSAAIVLDRAILAAQGLIAFDIRHPGNIAVPLVMCVVLYVVTGSTVLFLMRISAQSAARRERALSSEISARNVQLEDANDVLRARRQMTADIAHELRNPLTTISGYAQAIRSGELDPTPERLDAIHRQTERLNGIIEDLRTLSLADVGTLALTMKLLAPGDILHATAESYAVEAQERGITLDCSIEDELPPINADAQRLSQVLGNLVSNALRHTLAGGRVTLTGRSEPHWVVIGIADSGEGIAPKELPFIFDRFYRAPSRDSRSGSGSGLGLAIAKALVTAHSGTIEVDSALGQGTTFTIRLPA